MTLASALGRLLPPIRPRERGRVAFFVALGGVITLGQTVGLAGAEALFLTRLGAGALPATFVLASLVTVAVSFVYALRVGRARNDRVFVEVLGLAALAIVVAGLGAWYDRPASLPALLCLFFATQAVFLNHFWTFSADFFDTLSAQRVVPVFTLGMSLGGALGGGLALGLGARAPAESLLGAWALMLLASALGVRLARVQLRRWGGLEVEEEDDTSVSGMRAAMRYLGRSSFGRWLVASALAMVLALFVAQYLYSDVLAREFPDEARLAAFLGLFLAVTNLVEMVVEGWITPWLIRRGGVPRANLAHPVLTVLSFAVLAASFRLPAALLARMNREMLENALAGPVRNLVYNALPLRFRARIRAFLEGIVVYGGMSLAGGILLLAGGLSAPLLCGVGGGLAGIYLYANARVRREYRRAIVEELRARRLDLRALGGELGQRELSELAGIWAHLLRTEARRPSPVLLQLAPLLAARGFLEPLERALAHSHPAVRRACLAALATTPAAERAELWLGGLRDADPVVRCEAITAAPDTLVGVDPVLGALRDALTDSDPDVRAEAARRLGPEGTTLLTEMARSPEARVAVAALARLPATLALEARGRLADPHAEVRAAALGCLARVPPPAPVETAAVLKELAHPDARVRGAAVRCLASRPEPEVDAALAEVLADRNREVRRAAASALSERGERGVEAVTPVLRADAEAAARSALRVLGAGGTPAVRERLRSELRAQVRAAWDAQLCLRALPFPGDGASALLHMAHGDELARQVRLAFVTLSLLEDVAVVRSVERTLRFSAARARGDALEVLSNLGDRAASSRLALLLERTPLEDRVAALLPGPSLPRGIPDVIDRSRRASARWIRLAAEAASAQSEPHGGKGLMQRLLFLRQVGLFSGLTLDQLEAIEGMCREAEYVEDEVIVSEGAPGKELYLIVEGDVDVLKNHGTPGEVRLNTLGAGSYFGEMAVLDSAPRSATVVARSPARLLTLDGERLRELIHEMPDIAFEIFSVLAARIRAAERRLGETRTASSSS